MSMRASPAAARHRCRQIASQYGMIGTAGEVFCQRSMSTSASGGNNNNHASSYNERRDDEKVVGAGRTTPQATNYEAQGGMKVMMRRAEAMFQRFVNPNTLDEQSPSVAKIIPGKATPRGTAATISRSTLFAKQFHVCHEPVNWVMSKLGVRTHKMANFVKERSIGAVEFDDLQLMILRGANVFELDAQCTHTAQQMSLAMLEVMEAFELPREGIITTARIGIIRQKPYIKDDYQLLNTGAVREKTLPVLDRCYTASFPQISLMKTFQFCEMTDEQFKAVGLRKLSDYAAVALSPDWIDGALSNIALQMKFETVDLVLLEGLFALYDGRPEAIVEEEVAMMFAHLEKLSKEGIIQYYGVASYNLAPECKKVCPPLPSNALVPEKFLKPPEPHQIINLYKLLALAERVGGKEHKFRFVGYPFNMTYHQSFSEPLPYDKNHNLLSLSASLGLNRLGFTPIEADDVQGYPQRYHRFPAHRDRNTVKTLFNTALERAVAKEVEIKPYLERQSEASLPPLEELMLASFYVICQRQLTNAFQVTTALEDRLYPKFRNALIKLRVGAIEDVKQWANQYQTLVGELFKLKRDLLYSEHQQKSEEIQTAIEQIVPRMVEVPMLSQRAINFAMFGSDVVMSGMYTARYFLEATEMNPWFMKNTSLTAEEVEKLCNDMRVSFAATNPPHPYMLEMPMGAAGRISGQQPLTPMTFKDLPDDVNQLFLEASPHLKSASDHRKEAMAKGHERGVAEGIKPEN